jgi:hypothetical protein
MGRAGPDVSGAHPGLLHSYPQIKIKFRQGNEP